MSKIFKGFALSLSMLSIIPFFKVHNFYKGINGYGVMFYPFVGALLGTLLYGVYYLLAGNIAQVHLGIIIFSLWVLMTGALHLDGFADTVDGLFVSKERALEIMKDPHNGGMGMIFTGVFLLLKASSVVALGESVYLLPLVMLLARLSVVLEIYLYPYITINGMGSLAKSELKIWQVGVTLLYSFTLVIFLNAFFLALIMFVTLFFLKLFFIKRYGGFSGDIYGFSIEAVELVLLNSIIIGCI
ncbi:adenosylcobinamide-GDP ribazoletransferase [Sulfurimonas sp.]